MALARCGIVAVARRNVIWGRNLCHGSGTGRVAEMVDPHCVHISQGRLTTAHTTSAESMRHH